MTDEELGKTLDTVEIEPKAAVRASVIWMHGLGADAHDFEPIIPELRLPAESGVRFVFPNAPVRAVTVNGGMRMRAWYDIKGADLPRDEDNAGIRESERNIQALIRREVKRGLPVERIVLAGFSQGGAIALHTGLRYPERLAGIIGLSCYMLLADSLARERHPANQEIPIFMAHGAYDPVVPFQLGHAAFRQLQTLDYDVEWNEYPMQHQVVWEEIWAIGEWLAKVLE